MVSGRENWPPTLCGPRAAQRFVPNSNCSSVDCWSVHRLALRSDVIDNGGCLFAPENVYCHWYRPDTLDTDCGIVWLADAILWFVAVCVHCDEQFVRFALYSLNQSRLYWWDVLVDRWQEPVAIVSRIWIYKKNTHKHIHLLIMLLWHEEFVIGFRIDYRVHVYATNSNHFLFSLKIQ